MDLRLKDKRCVVTGGSSGIGLACAEEAVAEGSSVLLVARDRVRVEDAARRLRAQGGLAQGLVVDVTDAHAPGLIFEAAMSAFGGVDALVNSAGGSRSVPMELIDEDEWRRQWELNVMAPKRLIEAFVSARGDIGGGSVVNICSSAGRRPSSTNGAYAIAKRGEIALTQAYAERYRATGIRINGVAPGPTASELWLAPGGLLDQTGEAEGLTREEALARTGARLPLGRLATPAEVAAVVVLLLAGVGGPNGEVWSVDGGHVPDVAG